MLSASAPFVLAALALPAAPQDARPPLFAERGFDQALADSARAGRVLVLDAMTSWCGPCKQMDRTTWRDDQVARWFDQHGLAIQLDMDEHVALKERLGINAFPTIVAFRDGREFDRIVGLRHARELLDWLEGVRTGTTRLDQVQSDLDAARASGSAGWSRRLELTGELAASRDDTAQATVLEELTWLWENRPAADADGARTVRLRLGTQLSAAARLGEPARARVGALRDELTPRILALSASEPERSDWLALNVALEEEEASARWADGLAASEHGVAVLRAHETELFDLLVRHGRWRPAGLALADPVEQLRRMGSLLGAYDLPAEGEVPPGGAMPAIPLGGPGAGRAAPASASRPGVPLDRPSSPPSDAGTKSPGARALPAIPMGAPASTAARRPQTPEEIARDVRERLTWQFRIAAADRYAALLAADRMEEAHAAADVLLEAAGDARARAALVSRALRAGVLELDRERCQRWLNEAAD